MQIIHQHPQRKIFVIAYTYFKGFCPLIHRWSSLTAHNDPYWAKVGTEVATQPVGIYYPNETPEQPLKTIKVLNLFRLPFRGADNCQGMFSVAAGRTGVGASKQM